MTCSVINAMQNSDILQGTVMTKYSCRNDLFFKLNNNINLVNKAHTFCVISPRIIVSVSTASCWRESTGDN